jgi:hypothetical protein
VRAWRESGADPPLRARLIDVSATDERAIAVAAGVDEACAALRAWLVELASDVHPRR